MAGAPVLKGVDLSVRAGEFLVVLGPSGAGKSTHAALHQRPRASRRGRIVIDGREYHAEGGGEQRRAVAMIFQHHNLVRRLTVLKNVLVGRMAGHVVGARLAAVVSGARRRDRDGVPGARRAYAQGALARRSALRRRAAARRHRPRARAGAGRDPGRRAGREPRSEDLAHRARLSQAHLQGDQHRGDLQSASGRLRDRVRRAHRRAAGRIGRVRRRAVGADLGRRAPHLSGARRPGHRPHPRADRNRAART